jgi:hypothetical protein
MSHRCPIAGCTTIVADHLAFCGPHHRLVPIRLAAPLLSKWNTLQRMKRGKNSTLLLRAAKEYSDALAAVVAHVNRQLEGMPA